jgi:hypothetical protein
MQKKGMKVFISAINLTLITSIVIFLLDIFQVISIDYNPFPWSNSEAMKFFVNIFGLLYEILKISFTKVFWVYLLICFIVVLLESIIVNKSPKNNHL